MKDTNIDMKKNGVDVLISAPQKGWSASPCAGLVMINDFARSKLEDTKNSSFALSLKTWVGIMDSYTNGGHAYHGTMPTDALKEFRNAINEASIFGFDRLKDAQQELGNKVRACLKARQIKSVAAPGFEAPGVIVSYTTDPLGCWHAGMLVDGQPAREEDEECWHCLCCWGAP